MPRPGRRSTPSSDRDSSTERTHEFRVHVADLGPDVDEGNIRSVFQRFGKLLDVWVATASSFAFVVYKHKDEAQKAIDQMDGRYDRSKQRETTIRVFVLD
jgi:RNA recognition motif-containing protein